MNYFISYTTRTESNKQWARWVEWVLEKRLGHSTIMQEYDSELGGNFKSFMDDALKWSDVVVLILSNEYMKSENCREEWTNAKRLLPIKFDNCKPEGLLKHRVYVDLCGLAQDVAREKLLKELDGCVRSTDEPAFVPFTDEK